MSEYKNIGSVRNVLLTFIVTTLVISTVFIGASAQLGLLSSDDFFGDEEASAVGSVPEKANLVARVDIDGLMNDETTQQIAEKSSESFVDSEKSFKDVIQKTSLGTVENRNSDENTEITVGDVGEMIVFGEVGIQGSLVGKNDYRATIIEIDANPEQVNKLFYNSESNFTYEYQNQRVLENEDGGQVAVVGDNLYIVGEETAVQDSIDVALGKKPSIDEDTIPDVEGDTYVNMLLYRGNDLFGEFGSGELENVPIPNNISLTYSSTDQGTIIVNILAKFNSETSLNVSSITESGLSDYKNVRLDSTSNTEEIEIEVAPENVERLDRELNNVFGSTFDA